MQAKGIDQTTVVTEIKLGSTLIKGETLIWDLGAPINTVATTMCNVEMEALKAIEAPTVPRG